jgi:hypothetical protein
MYDAMKYSATHAYNMNNKTWEQGSQSRCAACIDTGKAVKLANRAIEDYRVSSQCFTKLDVQLVHPSNMVICWLSPKCEARLGDDHCMLVKTVSCLVTRWRNDYRSDGLFSTAGGLVRRVPWAVVRVQRALCAFFTRADGASGAQ